MQSHMAPVIGSSNSNENGGASAGSGMITVKAQCAGVIRRIPILNRDLTFNELCLMMQRLFKEQLTGKMDLRLQYRDDEGDWVLLTEDLDIAHALSLSSVLHISVQPPPPIDKSRRNAEDWESVQSLAEQWAALQTQVTHVLEKLVMAASRVEVQPSSPRPRQPSDGQGSSAKTNNAGNTVKPLTTSDLQELVGSMEKSAHSSPPASASVQAPPEGPKKGTLEASVLQQADKVATQSPAPATAPAPAPPSVPASTPTATTIPTSTTHPNAPYYAPPPSGPAGYYGMGYYYSPSYPAYTTPSQFPQQQQPPPPSSQPPVQPQASPQFPPPGNAPLRSGSLPPTLAPQGLPMPRPFSASSTTTTTTTTSSSAQQSTKM